MSCIESAVTHMKKSGFHLPQRNIAYQISLEMSSPSDNMTIIADCVDEGLRQTVDNYENSNIKIIHEKLGSNGASFRFQIDFATSLPDDEIVLFEDDYLYKPSGFIRPAQPTMS